MRLVWTAHFELPPTALGDAVELLTQWVRSPGRVPDLEGTLVPGDKTYRTGRIQVDQHPPTGSPKYWALRYERTAADQGLVWTTEVALALGDEAVSCHARLFQRSLANKRPLLDRVVVRPPSFGFMLRDQGLLGPRFQIREVSAGDVDTLLNELLDQKRTFPVVAVSVEPYSERPLLDAKALQDALIGIAQVVLVRKDASLALPAAFERRGAGPSRGKVWGVYGGAVKVYRRTLSMAETPFDHPLWLPGDVSAPQSVARLKEWCWSLAALETPDEAVDIAAIRRLNAAAPSSAPDEAWQALLLEEENKRLAAEERAKELADAVRQHESTIQALKFQIRSMGRSGTSTPAGEDFSPLEIGDAADAVQRARSEFAETLLIPPAVAIDTRLEGSFWYSVLLVLHQLCDLERSGAAKNKREQLRQLLSKHVGLAKDTFKVADTGVYITNPEDGTSVHLRERVHLKEGKPAETESLYWQTIGSTQPQYRYLVGRLGRHP
jgi:hypothetical protein